MYLENIFTAPDIRKSLASEASKFDTVDKFFKQLMGKVHKQPNVMRTLKTTQNINENLTTQNDTLEFI